MVHPVAVGGVQNPELVHAASPGLQGVLNRDHRLLPPRGGRLLGFLRWHFAAFQLFKHLLPKRQIRRGFGSSGQFVQRHVPLRLLLAVAADTVRIQERTNERSIRDRLRSIGEAQLKQAMCSKYQKRTIHRSVHIHLLGMMVFHAGMSHIPRQAVSPAARIAPRCIASNLRRS